MIRRILTVIALLASVSALPVVNAQAATVHATMSVTATVTAACTMQVGGRGVNVSCSQATAYTVVAMTGVAPGVTVANAGANVETMLVAY